MLLFSFSGAIFMADRFQNSSPSLAGPASHGFPVSPSDSAALAETTRGIFVGTGGTIAAVMASGASVTFVSVASGSLLPVRLTKVMATGTTAGNIVALV
jgi:hypothetical protein